MCCYPVVALRSPLAKLFALLKARVVQQAGINSSV
jgi:hypothetical protein